MKLRILYNSLIFDRAILMDSRERNFYRLLVFLVDICPDVFRTYFKRTFLCGEAFETYLNRNIHILFHLYIPSTCCKCKKNLKKHKIILSKEQFESLYVSSQKPIHHVKGKTCLCNYTAKLHISEKTLDITLAHCILKNCEKLNQSADLWMTTVKTIRNKMVHISDSKCIEDVDFEYYWQKLQGSALGLAQTIDKEYSDTVLANIEYHKSRYLISEDKVKELSVLHEWLRAKCVDIENLYMEKLEYIADKTKEIDENSGKNFHDFNKKLDSISHQIRSLPAELFQGQSSYTEKTQNSLPFAKSETVGRKIASLAMDVEIPEEWGKNTIENAILSMKSFFENLGSQMTISSCSVIEARGNSSTPRYVDSQVNTSYKSSAVPQTGIMMDKKKMQKKLFVRIEKNGNVRMVEYMASETILHLKRLLQISEGFHPDLQLLYHESTLLDDSKLVSYYDVEDKVLTLRVSPSVVVISQVWLAYELLIAKTARKIYIYTEQGKIIPLNCLPYNRVLDIKKKIQNESEIPYYKQCLCYNGRVLGNDQDLKSLGIEENTVLNLYYYVRFPRPVTQLQICYNI